MRKLSTLMQPAQHSGFTELHLRHKLTHTCLDNGWTRAFRLAPLQGLDREAVRALYTAIRGLRSIRVMQALGSATEKLLMFLSVGAGIRGDVIR